MKIKRTLLPGQPGTKKWVGIYHDDLVCIRYRYDDKSQQMLKTVEIIVEKKRWKKNPERIPKNKIVKLRIRYGEVNLARVVKSAGGRWNAVEKVWEVPYQEVCALNLQSRMVEE